MGRDYDAVTKVDVTEDERSAVGSVYVEVVAFRPDGLQTGVALQTVVRGLATSYQLTPDEAERIGIALIGAAALRRADR